MNYALTTFAKRYFPVDSCSHERPSMCNLVPSSGQKVSGMLMLISSSFDTRVKISQARPDPCFGVIMNCGSTIGRSLTECCLSVNVFNFMEHFSYFLSV